jgi:hypothetical protein
LPRRPSRPVNNQHDDHAAYHDCNAHNDASSHHQHDDNQHHDRGPDGNVRWLVQLYLGAGHMCGDVPLPLEWHLLGQHQLGEVYLVGRRLNV